MSTSSGPWLELLMAHYAGQIRDKFDALVAFVHWVYLGEGCVCVGSPPPEMEMTPTRVASLLRDSGGGSELLPTGWNSSSDTFSLAYKLPTSTASNPPSPPTVILLKAVRIGDELTVNVIKPGSDNVSSISLIPNDLVKDDLTLKHQMFKDVSALTKTIKTGVLDAFMPPKAPAASRSNSRNNDQYEDNYDPDNRDPTYSSLREPTRSNDPLRDLGRADLDPFSGFLGGGGMVFDPMRAGGRGGTPLGPDGRPLPQGAVPPGARFDPFGPGGVGGMPGRGGGRGRGRGRGFGPDPDHSPPPGWDDMFM